MYRPLENALLFLWSINQNSLRNSVMFQFRVHINRNHVMQYLLFIILPDTRDKDWYMNCGLSKYWVMFKITINCPQSSDIAELNSQYNAELIWCTNVFYVFISLECIEWIIGKSRIIVFYEASWSTWRFQLITAPSVPRQRLAVFLHFQIHPETSISCTSVGKITTISHLLFSPILTTRSFRHTE